MSSHHIVRENQEPALLIVNPQNFDPENLGQLLEWSPTVLVAEPAFDYVESLGIKIDILLSADVLPVQHSTKMLLSENNIIEDALKHLVAGQYSSVNIIDTTFSLKDYALFADKINLVIYTPHLKIFPVTSGFNKWKPKDERIYFLHDIQQLSTTGLTGSESERVTEKDGFYTLTFNQPFAFIGEDI